MPLGARQPPVSSAKSGFCQISTESGIPSLPGCSLDSCPALCRREQQAGQDQRELLLRENSLRRERACKPSGEASLGDAAEPDLARDRSIAMEARTSPGWCLMRARRHAFERSGPVELR